MHTWIWLLPPVHDLLYQHVMYGTCCCVTRSVPNDCTCISSLWPAHDGFHLVWLGLILDMIYSTSVGHIPRIDICAWLISPENESFLSAYAICDPLLTMLSDLICTLWLLLYCIFVTCRGWIPPGVVRSDLDMMDSTCTWKMLRIRTWIGLISPFNFLFDQHMM